MIPAGNTFTKLRVIPDQFYYNVSFYVLLFTGMQQRQNIEQLMVQYWASVVDGGRTLNQKWLNVSCLLGIHVYLLTFWALTVLVVAEDDNGKFRLDSVTH